jgi:hypothetical protein
MIFSYLTALLINQALQRQVVERSMFDEFDRIWKDVVMS